MTDETDPHSGERAPDAGLPERKRSLKEALLLMKPLPPEDWFEVPEDFPLPPSPF